jgi:PIN domain nuclease of toxin-antitoxin system
MSEFSRRSIDRKKMADKLWQLGIDPEKVRLLSLEESIGTQIQPKPEPLENNLELLTIALEHVWGLDSLPYHHQDLFDRLLIAQAETEEMTLVSADGMFRMYEVELLVV